MKPRVLFIVPADLERLRAKGVTHLIRQRDEGGFFAKVVTVHPLAACDRVVDLDDVHRVHEFALGDLLARAERRAALLPVVAARLLGAARAIVRIARDERVDLVRATDPYLMGLLGWWAARALGVPFCVSLHADYEKTFSLTPAHGLRLQLRAASRVLPRFVVGRADLLLPISEYLAGHFRGWGAPPAAIRVIPHGVATAAFQAPAPLDVRAMFGIPRAAPIVSWISRMSGENYAADIPEIVERVHRAHPGAVFVLAGDGPCRETIAARLAPLADAVRLLPFQPQEAVVAIRQASTAALCLIGGFSLIEACAAGLPAVVYDVEWHREIVADGESGFVVPERDAAAAAGAVSALLASPARAATMGCAARRRAAGYDVATTSRIKRACYAELLNMSVDPAEEPPERAALGLPAR